MVPFGEGLPGIAAANAAAAGALESRELAKKRRPSRPSTRAEPVRIAVMNILAATKATDDPTKPLVARVRRSIHLRLAKLEYELLAAKDVRTNKRELVEFFLSQMPEEADDRLAEQVLAFQQVSPRRPGRRRGS